MSKQFTAAAILQLADAGKLNVEDPVSKYYPDSPPASKGMTVHHLLTHTSGLPENETNGETSTKVNLLPTRRMNRSRRFAIAPWALRQVPHGNTGTRSTTLLAFIIEKLSGEPYASYLTHHIFEPLKMTHSGFETMTAIVPRMAEGYSHEGGNLVRREYFDRSMETVGGIYTTADDLLRWNKALDSPGLWSAQALDFMFTAHPPGNYGGGWFIESAKRRKIYHEGGDPGFAAFEARYPDQHVVIIVLSNEDDSPVKDIAEAMAKRLFGD